MGTENKEIKNRLSQLRKKMKENGVDYYMIPTADFHNSEYSADYFKTREYYDNCECGEAAKKTSRFGTDPLLVGGVGTIGPRTT